MHIAFGERTEYEEERNSEGWRWKEEMAWREREIGGVVKAEEK